VAQKRVKRPPGPASLAGPQEALWTDARVSHTFIIRLHPTRGRVSLVSVSTTYSRMLTSVVPNSPVDVPSTSRISLRFLPSSLTWSSRRRILRRSHRRRSFVASAGLRSGPRSKIPRISSPIEFARFWIRVSIRLESDRAIAWSVANAAACLVTSWVIGDSPSGRMLECPNNPYTDNKRRPR